ncbi:hypothetical protein CDD82_2846 [Ophiocordyceps australis]|uniref:Zn(2)-C6 fungal-type domain-containing protein n=1 Tax=Ophiocordyceps australis TaxID=1399860 RepID=A0A2C5ZMI9_9HYPO|nr:hypothetical protein CDD82_2846 [Ophiocordyceps australis]
MNRFKPLCPRPEASSSTAQPQEPTPPPGTVPKRSNVQRACELCRRRKLKCDTNRPRCTQCVKANQECQFGPDTWIQIMKRTGTDFKQALTNQDGLLELVQNLTLNQTFFIIANLGKDFDVAATVRDIEGSSLLLELAKSRHNTSLHNPDDWLDDGTRRLDMQYSANNSTRSTSRRQISSSFDHPEEVFEKAWQNTRDIYTETDILIPIPSEDLPISKWTAVPVNDKILNHILRLFWTWDTTGNRIIDRTMFESDLTTRDPGEKRKGELCFCSSFLVNAILALSCFYTTNDAVHLTPGYSSTRGAAFAIEARRLIALNDDAASLPFAQGMALFSMYEGEFGSIPSFMDYMDKYCDYYNNLGLYQQLRRSDRAFDDPVLQAISWISWGFYIFEWKFALPLNRRKRIKKPFFAKQWLHESCNLSLPETQEYWWYAYPWAVLPQRSYKREIFAAECALVEIIQDILDFLNPLDPQPPPTANPARAMELHKQLVDWKLSLPKCIGVERAMVPAAILLDAYFDDVIIALLRPFDTFSKEQFGSIDPKAASLEHANHLMSTIWTFRAHYTVRNQAWLTHLLAVCAFRVIFDLDTGPLQLDTFVKACQALEEIGSRFRIAQDVLASIQATITQYKIQLPACASGHYGNAGNAGASVMRHTVVPVSLGNHAEAAVGGRSNYTISDILAMLDHDMNIG